MKKILFIIAIIGLIFSVSSCGNSKKKANAGTHTHSDGTVHPDDAHDQDAKPKQETFEVKTDNDTEHKHAEGDNDSSEHKHEHGDNDGEHNHDKDTEHKHSEGDTENHDNDHDHGEHK